MLSSFRLLPTKLTTLKLTLWIFNTTLNPGWKENHDGDDVAVRFLFLYPWAARFDLYGHRLFPWTWLLDSFSIYFTFSLTRPFQTFSLMRTLKSLAFLYLLPWSKKGLTMLLEWLYCLKIPEKPALVYCGTSFALANTYISIILSLLDRLYCESFEYQRALEPFLCLCHNCEIWRFSLVSGLFLVVPYVCPFLLFLLEL